MRVRRLTPTLKELERMLAKATDPKEKVNLRSRIWSKLNPDKVSEYNRRYREAHPLTPKQREKYREAYYHRKYSGIGTRRYNKNARKGP